VSPSQKPPIRILVVDDHPIVRLGIEHLVTGHSDLTVCGEADSIDAGLRLAREHRPDLVTVDLSLTDGTGLDLVRGLHALDPALPILVLTVHDEALFAERALRAGARGYVMKREAVANLAAAIRRVLAGRLYVSERMSQIILERIGRAGTNTPQGRLGNLTDRELEVLDLMGRGLNTTAVAGQLRVSVKTIETYRSNIKTKLDLKDANELIRFAASWVDRQ
jgi:DNA-binding NarL/FixJ family response regulator